MKLRYLFLAIIFISISLVLLNCFHNFTHLLILYRSEQKYFFKQNKINSHYKFHHKSASSPERLGKSIQTVPPQIQKKRSKPQYTCADVKLLAVPQVKDADTCRRFGDLIPHTLLRYVQRENDEELCELVQPLFTRRKLAIWTSDHHSAPVLDLRALLEPLGVEFIDHTVYHHCDYYCHCAGRDGVKVLDSLNVLKLTPDLITNFQKAYPPEHEEISRADAFASFFCFSQFEMYRPYNKSIIAIAPMRFESCRSPRRWSELLGNLTELNAERHHVIGANNEYDREYIRYFTGIEAHLLPGFCIYTGTHYNPTKQTFLFSAQRFGLEGDMSELWNREFHSRYSNLSANFGLTELRSLYAMYNYEDLASHLGIVHIPYQVSTMSVFEQYHMCIPLFFPSHALLLNWNVRYRLLYDRTPAMKWGFSNASDIPPHSSQRDIPDPNDEGDPQSQDYWLRLADYNTLAHITHFDSVAELVEILHRMTRERLLAISAAMNNSNRSQLKQLLRFWRSRLSAIALHSPNRPA